MNVFDILMLRKFHFELKYDKFKMFSKRVNFIDEYYHVKKMTLINGL